MLIPDYVVIERSKRGAREWGKRGKKSTLWQYSFDFLRITCFLCVFVGSVVILLWFVLSRVLFVGYLTEFESAETEMEEIGIGNEIRT